MSTLSDPFGAALLAYANGKHDAVLKVHTNVSEIDELPASYFFRAVNQMPELEQEALRQCTGKVLDLGAGAGAHALALQEKLTVVAVDNSAGAVATMKMRGVQKAICADLREVSLSGYQTILLLMNGIGPVGTLQGLAVFFNKVAHEMDAGCKLFLDSSDISYLYTDEDGSLLIDLNAPYYGEVTYQLEFESQMAEPFNWLFVDFYTLQDYAHQAGLTCECMATDENDGYLACLTKE